MKTVYYFVVLLTAIFFSSQIAAADDGKAFDAHATTFKYFFTDGDMDFHFGNLILGAAVNRGVEIGEAFYAASHIKDGDAADWQKHWYALAKRVQARGEASLAQGHTISAREQLMRAAYYYRISLLAMTPDNPDLLKRAHICRELMQKAGKLMDPPLEYVDIPFEDGKMSAIFRAARTDAKPAKTLVMIGGGETFIEDLYFYIAPMAFEHGYNFLSVDLPGQGIMPASGMIFRTDTYVPMKAVVDYALSRKEVDSERLAAYGISGGGLFVPQAAEHDTRIRAIAMNSAVVDGYELFATMPAATDTAEQMASWTSFHKGVVDSICWRYGVQTPAGLIDANKGNTFDPAKIEVPALIIVGEGDYKSQEVQKQLKVASEGFANPKSNMLITPADEGASNHCLMENRSIVAQVLFDWLDGVWGE